MSPKIMELKDIIRDIPNFPKDGILFKDITPVLKSADAFRYAVDALYRELENKQIDYIVGIESRGFIFSPVLAYKLNAGFIPVRKKQYSYFLPGLCRRRNWRPSAPRRWVA